MGSSPLTRGKQKLPQLQAPQPGLIPAHAGKTESGWNYHAVNRAHPRSRGENPGCDTVRPLTAGSSPLTRGKPRVDLHGVAPVVAHPRSRGENGRKGRKVGFPKGSSPLTRGKQGRGSEWRCVDGLIPAHAGKTPEPPPEPPPWPAHPRSRGENSDWETIDGRAGGSSPLTRGKQVVP